MINFNSKIAHKVLPYLLLNPDKEMYLNEIVRVFGVDRGNLSRKLSEWEKEGLLIKETKGNLSLYKINKEYYLLEEMKRIVQKSFGVEGSLRVILGKEKKIKKALIFGSYVKGKMESESDIDLLLVGSHKAFDIDGKIINLSNSIGREINVIDMTEEEFEKKKKEDEFIQNILNDKFIQII